MRVIILISDKIDIKTKPLKKDKEEPYIMINGSTPEEDFYTNQPHPNIYTTNRKGESENTIIVGECNTPLLINAWIF